MFELKFLTDSYFYILYGITLALAVIKYPKYFDSVLKYFPILIAYTLLNEILGWYILKHEDFQIVYVKGSDINNSFVYNIFDIVFFLYFFYVYWKSIQNIGHKIIIKNAGIAFILISIVNPFFENFWLLPQIYALTLGSNVLMICSILYLVKEKESISKNRNLLFWISIGLLIFYPVYPVIMIIGLKNDELYSNLVGTIHRALIAGMYICFIVGFLRVKRFRST